MRIRATRAARLIGLAIPLAIAAVACVKGPAGGKSVDPSDVLRAIPAADSAQYDRIADMKSWRNPYLIVRPEGVDLYDANDNAEIHLKTEEVIAALARLPVSAWPYGRVVALSEPEQATEGREHSSEAGSERNSERNSEQEAIAIRRNKGIVGGILQGVKVSVKWVPAA